MHLLRSAVQITRLNTAPTLRCFYTTTTARMSSTGDLNNTAAERARKELEVDPAYRNLSFALSQAQDDAEVRRKYRPFLLDEETEKSDWVSQLELSTVLKMVEDQVIANGQERLRVLVLHGSMRKR
jgi:arsenic resistance protein ArsH